VAAKDFDFTTQSTKDIEDKQAIVAIDNDADIELIVKTLKADGIRVLGKGKNGDHAMEMARKHKMGTFFLDYDISELGSNAVLEKLKIKCPNIKVVVISKQLNKEQVNDAKKRGVVGFLAKPLKDDAIKKILTKL